MRHILVLLLAVLAVAQSVTIADVRFTLKNQNGLVTDQFYVNDRVYLCIAPSGVSTTEAIVRVALVNPQGVPTSPMEYDFTGDRRLVSEQCIPIKDVASQDTGRWTIRIDVLYPDRRLKGTNQLLFSVSTPPPPPSPTDRSTGGGGSGGVGDGILWAVIAVVIAAAIIGAVLYMGRRSREREVVTLPPYPSPPPPPSASPPAPPSQQPTAVLPQAGTSAKTVVGTPLARLVLPDGKFVNIMQTVEEFGRSNFEGLVPPNVLNYISKRHFRIQLLGNKWYIEDLGSTNGTLVDGQQIKGKGPVELRPGVEIQPAGVISLRFEPLVQPRA